MQFRRAALPVVVLGFLPMCGGSTTDDGLTTDASGVPPTSSDASSRQDASTGPRGDASNALDSSSSPDASDAATTGEGGGAETLDVTFAFTGCNRLQKADWNVASNPSSANLPQLQQTFSDLASLTTLPKFLFFTGDLVLGLTADTTVLKSQLDGWANVYTTHPSGIAKKTSLVPLVGNHEMLQKTTAPVGGAKVEIQNAGADAIWTSWLKANAFDGFTGNGPTNAPPNADALQDDQSKLTYSFDDGDVHYVVLNTDTWTSTPDSVTGSTQIGWVALHWLEADLAAAQAKPETHHIFLFGHKPIVSPVPTPAADDVINAAFTKSLETLLVGTAKVRGYLCAHAHQWDARKLPGGGSHGVYQIIAGNGGSQLETAWSPAYYGFTVARVYTSGRVGISSYQRSVPSPYVGAAQPAVAQPELTIAP